MHTLHDATDRQAIAARIRSLRTDSARQWGRMSIDQMLWHVHQGLRHGLDEVQFEPVPGPPIPRGLFKWLVLRMPWPHGARTMPGFVADGAYDLEEQRAAVLRSIDAFASRDLASPWPRHCAFGAMSGVEWSRLIHKHLDHHLRQFSA